MLLYGVRSANIEVRTSDTYREVLAGGVRSEVGICQLKSQWNCAGSTHTGLQRRQLLADVCRFGEWSIGSSGRYRSALAKTTFQSAAYV